MKKYLINIAWGLMVVMAMSACSKEELVEEIKELDPTREIAVKSEITVDGVDVTNTRAATEAGYTTGDGLYDKDDPVIVAAFANEGYELTAFYDKKYPATNLGSSHKFPAEIPRTFKAEFRKNAEFIAVGKGGKIFTSTKTSKTVVQVGTNDWNAIASGSGKYVAVGSGGNITTSTDGRVWTTPRKVGNNSWISIAYGNGKFVAAESYNGYITTSTDGINWTTPKQPGTMLRDTWRDITYGNDRFVAVGTSNNSDAYTMTSPDGINWTGSNRIGIITDLNCVAYGNGVFAAGINKYIVSSTDGLNWTYREGYYNCKDMIFGKDKFVTVGKAGDIAYSSNAINWRSSDYTGSNYNWHNVTYGNGSFVAVGLYDTEYFISSTDGITWTTPKQLKDESGQALNMEINDICSIMPPDTGKTFHFKTAEPNGRLDWWGDREDFEDYSFSYTFTRSELGYNYDYTVTHDTNHSGWRWLVDGKEVINAGQYVDLVMSPEIYDRYPDNTTFTYDLLGGNPGTETYTITVKAARWSSPYWLQDVGRSKVGFDKTDLSSEKTIQAARGEVLTIYAQGADGFHPYPNDTDHWYYKVLGFYNTGHVAYKVGAPNNGGVDSYTFTVNEGMIIYVDFQYIS